jgi:hypothetical protein
VRVNYTSSASFLSLETQTSLVSKCGVVEEVVVSYNIGSLKDPHSKEKWSENPGSKCSFELQGRTPMDVLY